MAKIIYFNQENKKYPQSKTKDSKKIHIRLHNAKTKEVIDIEGLTEVELDKKIQDTLLEKEWYIGLCWVEHLEK